MKKQIKTAIITGGHPYDAIGFRKLWNSLEGIDAYVQDIENYSSHLADRKFYDVLVFYQMCPQPVDLNQWIKPLSMLNELGGTSQGIVVLHHALMTYREWQVWDKVTGIHDRKPPKNTAEAFIDQPIRVYPSSANSPIIAGMRPWDFTDETYLLREPDEQSTVLLTANQPNSMKSIAWVRQYKQSRVFCLQSGHDDKAWKNKDFRKILRRGICWTHSKTS